jgi:hypothetical protein
MAYGTHLLHILLSKLGPHNLNVLMIRYSLLIHKVVGFHLETSVFPTPSIVFGESVGFPQVLQGQEISQTVPLFQEMASDA